MVTGREALLAVPNRKELDLGYAQALAQMVPFAAQEVADLRQAYLQRRRELGATSFVAPPPLGAMAAPKPEVLPEKKKFLGCSSWVWFAIGTMGLLRLLFRLLGD